MRKLLPIIGGILIIIFAFIVGIKYDSCTCPGTSSWELALFILHPLSYIAPANSLDCGAFGCAQQTNSMFVDLYLLGLIFMILGIYKKK
ncbi:MAG TPA: hypothetical protein VK338_00250 [Candidatus Nitrosocosmicus sp.]|nr:hypothetical protein [Candidatus Nitrosocosmicus sp.]